jgi:hypothetical protein
VTDARKYEDVPGLQDNAEIFFRGAAARGRWLHWALYSDWVHTKEFLAAALASAFCVAFDQVWRVLTCGESKRAPPHPGAA